MIQSKRSLFTTGYDRQKETKFPPKANKLKLFMSNETVDEIKTDYTIVQSDIDIII